MLYADRQQRLHVSGKIGHDNYAYGLGQPSSSSMMMVAAGGRPGSNRGGGYTVIPPYAVDRYDGPPVLHGSPLGKMTYFGLVSAEEQQRNAAAALRAQQSGGGGVAQALGAGVDGSGLGGALVTRPPSASKLVPVDQTLLPPPGPGVYRHKPPLLFHSKPTAPFIVHPILPAPLPPQDTVMNSSIRSLPSLSTTDYFGSSSGRIGGGGGAGGAHATTSTSTTVITPRPASMPTNGQTFNIFYSDGLSERDQLLRRKMEEYQRAVELQQANAIEMQQHQQRKEEQERERKQREMEEEARIQRERDIIVQRELAEKRREEAEWRGKVFPAGGGGGGGGMDVGGGPASILVKTPKKKLREDLRDDVEQQQQNNNNNNNENNASSSGPPSEEKTTTNPNAPVLSWLSQPVPILTAKPKTPNTNSINNSNGGGRFPQSPNNGALTMYPSPARSLDFLKPIQLNLPPRAGSTGPLGSTGSTAGGSTTAGLRTGGLSGTSLNTGGGLAIRTTSGLSASPSNSLLSPRRHRVMDTTQNSPFGNETNRLQSTLQHISRDQERIVDLLERQTNLSGRSGSYGSAAVGGGGGGGVHLGTTTMTTTTSGFQPLSDGSRRSTSVKGAGTFLTEGLRMPAGQTGLSTLLSSAKPSHDNGGATPSAGQAFSSRPKFLTGGSSNTSLGNIMNNNNNNNKPLTFLSAGGTTSDVGASVTPLPPLVLNTTGTNATSGNTTLPPAAGSTGGGLPQLLSTPPLPNLSTLSGMPSIFGPDSTMNNNNNNTNNNSSSLGAQKGVNNPLHGSNNGSQFNSVETNFLKAGTPSSLNSQHPARFNSTLPGGNGNALGNTIRVVGDPDDLSIEPSKFIGLK